MVYHYTSFRFQLFEHVGNTPMLALHSPKSHTEAITHKPLIVTKAVVEHKGEQR